MLVTLGLTGKSEIIPLDRKAKRLCGDTKTEPIKALGHDLKETVITEPTCGTAGSKEVTCSRCDFKDTKEIPATGNHAYGDWVIVKEATCTEEGLRTKIQKKFLQQATTLTVTGLSSKKLLVPKKV